VSKRNSTFKIIISSDFEIDFTNAVEYYSKIKINLARKFIRDLKLTYNYLVKHPEKIQIRYDNVRIAFLKDFPYGIHFSIEENEIVIYALFHMKQNSDNWKNIQ
jgi:hypothetical protein